MIPWTMNGCFTMENQTSTGPSLLWSMVLIVNPSYRWRRGCNCRFTATREVAVRESTLLPAERLPLSIHCYGRRRGLSIYPIAGKEHKEISHGTFDDV